MMNMQAKKTLLRLIPYGLYVVGVKGHQALNAFTGTWISQCSLKPPMIMLGIRKDTYSLELLKEGEVLSVNFLAKDQQETFEHFFKPVKQEGTRLSGIPFHTDQTGAPILDSAIGYLEGMVNHIYEEDGDHAVVVAEVIQANIIKDKTPIVLADTNWSYGG
jgi:flavin reductase (DIM6/NTAB) family NADH-FMN oxidoreductase RutF